MYSFSTVGPPDGVGNVFLQPSPRSRPMTTPQIAVGEQGFMLTQTSRYEPYPSVLDGCGGWFRTFATVFVSLCAGIGAGILIDRTVLGTKNLEPSQDGSSQNHGRGMDIQLEDKTPSTVGCYPAINEEDGEDDTSIYDYYCVDNPNLRHCRMGLPFFRFTLQAGMSFVDCASFCMSKMMDLSGLSNSPSGKQICRCGASEHNYLTWGDEAKLNLLPPKHLNNQQGCGLVIYQTPSHDNFNLLAEMMEMNQHDGRYVAGVRMGVPSSSLHEDEKPTGETPPPQPVLLGGPNGQDQSYRACYPYACAEGGAWTTKEGAIVPINYYFSNLGAAAQSTFKRAIASYEEKTCLRFRESTSKPRFRIDSANPNSCSATVGYPGTWQDGHLNMGWCNTMGSLGNVIHELGHIIGRTHTQRRPDATQAYAGHGPYLRIQWQNVPSDWRSQYTPSKSAYIGSNYQGKGDPFDGYMQYDYTSIMSYGPGGVNSGARMIATNSAYQGQMGQRDGMTDMDILAVKDMYQCGADGSGVGPAASPCFGVFVAVLAAAIFRR